MELAPEGTAIVAVDRPGTTPAASGAAVEWLELDLSEPGFVRSLPGEVDAIVHLAQSPRDRDFPEGADEVLGLAVGATAGLLDHARRSGISRLVLASTATVYAPSAKSLNEESELGPSSFYAASKRSAELIAHAYRELVSCLVLRLFTLYGPGQRERLIADLARKVREGEPVQLEGERGLLLSPTYVDDAAKAIHGLLADGGGTLGFETVNVAGDEALGIREIAERIGEAVGREPVFERSGDEDPGGLVADCSKLKGLLPDFRPTPFQAGIRDVIGAGSG